MSEMTPAGPSMTEQAAEVIRVSQDQAWLQPQVLSACAACGVRKSCGSGALAAWSGRRGQLLQVTNDCQARVGDRVLIGISDLALVQAAVLAYLLPLLGMVLVSLAVVGSGGSDAQAALGAALALAGGLLAARHLSRRRAAGLRPRMLKILQPAGCGGSPVQSSIQVGASS